jgi:glyoxylase-like metal-dependent hydrolase (beta-lactamase superfamily II)
MTARQSAAERTVVRPPLPKGVTVFERGWLSSNNVLIVGAQSTGLIDSGYGAHSAQTLALVEAALGGRSLDVLVNTHLHSDHCGGNAALQAAYPRLHTLIPPGHAEQVRRWDTQALSYAPTGQTCPRFGFSGVLVPGSELQLGDLTWQVHAAPGHDPHSVILFETESATLVSADALWERGFGVVFPEMEGVQAFHEVSATLDLIESLAPRTVIPGHGAVFSDVAQSIASARSRLASFVANPHKHIRHAAKVLLKFKLLEAQTIEKAVFTDWARATPYYPMIFGEYVQGIGFADWIDELLQELVAAGAATMDGPQVRNL